MPIRRTNGPGETCSEPLARDKFSGTSFHTWLLTIGYNLLKNHYRHSEHEKNYESFAFLTSK